MPNTRTLGYVISNVCRLRVKLPDTWEIGAKALISSYNYMIWKLDLEARLLRMAAGVGVRPAPAAGKPGAHCE
jgi:hypothetical protein